MNKVAVITGGSSGIGKVTAKTLALEGYRVIILARDVEKGQGVVSRFKGRYPNTYLEFIPLDLTDFAAVRAFGKSLREAGQPIDVLLLNAGLFDTKLQTAECGHERMFATTHLGHFLLTHELLPLLEQAEQARIVVTSSVAHFLGTPGGFFDKITSPPKYGLFLIKPALAYGRSKLANLLFVRELSKRLKDKGILVNAFHPGGVRTHIWRSTPKPVTLMLNPFLVTKERGADTQIYLALNKRLDKTGKYWVNRKPKFSSLKSKHATLIRDLWNYSEEVLNIRKFGKPDN